LFKKNYIYICDILLDRINRSAWHNWKYSLEINMRDAESL